MNKLEQLEKLKSPDTYGISYDVIVNMLVNDLLYHLIEDGADCIESLNCYNQAHFVVGRSIFYRSSAFRDFILKKHPHDELSLCDFDLSKHTNINDAICEYVKQSLVTSVLESEQIKKAKLIIDNEDN